MKALKNGFSKSRPTRARLIDFPLQGSKHDLPLETVLGFTAKQRRQYILRLLTALGREVQTETMALKKRVSFAREMRDLRNLLYEPVDKYLYTDEKTRKRNILGRGSPGSTHTFWSRTQMWKMATKGGDLHKMIVERDERLVARLQRLFDPDDKSKANLRVMGQTAVQNALKFLQFQGGVGSAFPPFHARFFADKYLPRDGGIVIDPCAGWGGRLIGTLCVPRTGQVKYYATDPEVRNRAAYDGLTRRVNVWLEKELHGKRTSQVSYRPFEDWLKSKKAQQLCGKADLVITSPLYFSAENYNPSNRKQSANRYTNYELWRELFFKRLVNGAFDLLKDNGTFVLNIADVAGAPRLERDARILATEAGFVNAGFYKLAMSINPSQRVSKSARHTVMVDGSLFKYEPVFVFKKGKRPVEKSVTANSAPTAPRSGHRTEKNLALTAKLAALTPIQRHDGIYFKRDDLFRPFSDIGVSGGKIRQCLSLVEKNLRMIREYHAATIATAASVHSPQSVIVARVAKHYGLKCVIGCGTAVPMKHPALQLCKSLGAEIRTLVTRNGYTKVLESRLELLRKKRAFYTIRFGYQADTDPEAIIDQNARQVRNIPKDVEVLVIPVGSGVSAQGILAGIKRFRPTVTVFLIQPFGYNRKVAVPSGLIVKHFEGDYSYASLLTVKISDFELDAIYEAKAFDYMRTNLKRQIQGKKVCFWVIGNANGMRQQPSVNTWGER